MPKRNQNSVPPSTRLYVVLESVAATEDEPATTKPVALIRTTSAAAGLRHFVTPKYECKLADQETLYACAEAQIKPEVAEDAA
jgi:hypothetical protein